jgi:hypothetical protein
VTRAGDNYDSVKLASESVERTSFKVCHALLMTKYDTLEGGINLGIMNLSALRASTTAFTFVPYLSGMTSQTEMLIRNTKLLYGRPYVYEGTSVLPSQLFTKVLSYFRTIFNVVTKMALEHITYYKII